MTQRLLPSALALIVSILLAATAFAQGLPPTPPPAAPSGGGTGGEVTTQVIGVFESLAEASAKNKPNLKMKAAADDRQLKCPLMGQALNKILDEQSAVLSDAAYSTESASPEQQQQIITASTTIGDNPGKCFDDAEVKRFMQRFKDLSAALSGP